MRRSIVFMVRAGFGLNDLRTLYMDEFTEFYSELVYSMEVSKELPEGTYDKMKGIDRTSENLMNLFAKVKGSKPTP